MPKRKGEVDIRQLLTSLNQTFPWAEEFCEQLSKLPARKIAFHTLLDEGCQPSDVLQWLHLSCSKDLQTNVSDDEKLADEARDFAEILENASKRLPGVEKSLLVRPGLKIVDHPEFQALAGKMKSYAEYLNEDAKQLRSGTPLRMTSRLAAGVLAAIIEGTTGETHFVEIARLMEAYYEMQGTPKSIQPASIGKTVKRFQDANRVMYDHIRDSVHKHKLERSSPAWPF